VPIVGQGGAVKSPMDVSGPVREFPSLPVDTLI
jgi:hypothetical protein